MKKKQCLAINLDGKRCKNTIQPGNQIYCAIHESSDLQYFGKELPFCKFRKNNICQKKASHRHMKNCNICGYYIPKGGWRTNRPQTDLTEKHKQLERIIERIVSKRKLDLTNRRIKKEY